MDNSPKRARENSPEASDLDNKRLSPTSEPLQKKLAVERESVIEDSDVDTSIESVTLSIDETCHSDREEFDSLTCKVGEILNDSLKGSLLEELAEKDKGILTSTFLYRGYYGQHHLIYLEREQRKLVFKEERKFGYSTKTSKRK